MSDGPQRAATAAVIIAALLVVAAAGAGGSVAVESASAAPTQINACATITQPGLYQLASDIRESTNNPCITIAANDVVLDGAGYTVDGTGSGVGISTSHNSNVTVADVMLSEWETGVNFESVTDAAAQNVTATNNTNGISLRFSANAAVTNSSASGNVAGIYVYGSDSTLVSNNEVRDNKDGIYVGSDSNTLTDNVATANDIGIHVEGGSENEFTDTTVADNNEYGIQVRFGSDNVFTDVTARNNTADFYSYGGSVTNVSSMSLAPESVISFTSRDVSIDSGAIPPTVPDGSGVLGPAMNATATGTGSWLNATIHYTDEQAATANVNETTLQLWRYANGNWEQLLGRNVAESDRNTVNANVTALESTPSTLIALGQLTENETETPGEGVTPEEDLELPEAEVPEDELLTESEPPDADPSELATYVNEEGGYSIQYPANWEVDESNPERVSIRPETGNGEIAPGTLGLDQTYSPDQLTQALITSTSEQTDNFTVLGVRDITLPSGQEARVIDSMYGIRGTDVVLRSKAVVVQVGDTAYLVEVSLPQEEYTDEFDQVANTVVESLTIEDTHEILDNG